MVKLKSCNCLPRILVVDDNNFNMDTIKMLLGKIKVDSENLKIAKSFPNRIEVLPG